MRKSIREPTGRFGVEGWNAYGQKAIFVNTEYGQLDKVEGSRFWESFAADTFKTEKGLKDVSN